jgi:hypothetical protein
MDLPILLTGVLMSMSVICLFNQQQKRLIPVLPHFQFLSGLEGKVPREWKSATVVPIHKKGSKREAGNYRPVSLTSIPCKVLESVIKDRMMEHLISNSLIKDTQHGFMPWGGRILHH